MIDLDISIKQIIHRKGAPFQTGEMIAVIQEYIKLRTGKVVSISLTQHHHNQLMLVAFDSALEWIFKNTNYGLS